MSQEPPAGASGPIIHEIKTMPPERAYAYRSVGVMTYVTMALVGVNALTLAGQFVGIAGRWVVLLQIQNQGFSSREAMVNAAQSSDNFVRIAAVLTLLTLLPAYIAGSIWIYNTACNIRALGARGMQISPGWAVGWFAIPFAALVMPFQGMREIYLASRSPIGWQRLPAPMLLRWWWGAWLVAGIGGSLLSIVARAMKTLPEVITVNQLLLADVTVDLAACVLFLVIIWQVYRAQAHSQSQVRQVAQVFT